MSMVIQLIKTLTSSIRSKKGLDDVDLSESADEYDLERRIREIEQGSRRPSSGLACGLSLL
jgi:hypothetical protein